MSRRMISYLWSPRYETSMHYLLLTTNDMAHSVPGHSASCICPISSESWPREDEENSVRWRIRFIPEGTGPVSGPLVRLLMRSQYEYAAQILLVATMAVAKASLALLIQSLMAEGHSLLASRSLLGIIVAWGVTAVFTIAFGCSLPSPWDFTGHCINLVRKHGIWKLNAL